MFGILRAYALLGIPIAIAFVLWDQRKKSQQEAERRRRDPKQRELAASIELWRLDR